MPTQALTKQKITITVPEPLADKFNERALKAGHTLEAEIVSRMAKCVDHTASTPIYVDDDARNRLSEIAGRLIVTVDDLLTWAHNISTMKVQGVEVTLDQRLLSRIEGRRFGQSLASTIKRETVEGLERSVGLR